MNKNSYDVVIPIKNGSDFIKEAICSVLSQTVEPCHIIVIDDHSTDNSREIVEDLINENSKIKIFTNPGYGVSSARNMGINQVDADVVAFLDCDDIWEPKKMEIQLPKLENYSLVHCGFFYLDGKSSGQRFQIPKELRENSDIYTLIYPVTGSASAVIAYLSELKQAGLFDPNLQLAEDLDMWVRLAALRGVFGVPECVVHIRIHQASTQGKRDEIAFKVKEFKNLTYMWEKNLHLFPAVENPQKKYISWVILDYRFNLRRILQFTIGINKSLRQGKIFNPKKAILLIVKTFLGLFWRLFWSKSGVQKAVGYSILISRKILKSIIKLP